MNNLLVGDVNLFMVVTGAPSEDDQVDKLAGVIRFVHHHDVPGAAEAVLVAASTESPDLALVNSAVCCGTPICYYNIVI